MLRYVTFLVFVLVFADKARAQPQVIAGPITSPVNGHVYYLLSADTWTNSQAKAQQLGGNLATIRTAAEDEWILSTFGPYVSGANNGLWIGFTDAGRTPLDYAWISGEPFSYSHWSWNEPNQLKCSPGSDCGGYPQYGQLFGPDDSRRSEWNDQKDVNVFTILGVVEVTATANTTITTEPAGLNILVDGQTYTSPRSFQWVKGSIHTLGVPLQQSGSGSSHQFIQWSNGGAATQTISVNGDLTLTATFATAFQLVGQVQPVIGGSILRLPDASDGFFASGTAVQLTAVPSAGYAFSGWSGSLSGISNPLAVAITAPTIVTANFACVYSLSPAVVTVAASGGMRQVSVGAGSGCQWNSGGLPSWLSIVSSASGSGSGTVSLSVQANASPTSRSATFTVAGQQFTVNQAGAACIVSPDFNSLAVAAAGGNTTVGFTASAPSCQWTLSSGSSWITITSPTAGSGSGVAAIQVLANPSTLPRSGQIQLTGDSGVGTVAINQAGATNGQQSSGLRFVPLDPCRVMETRQEYNFQGRTGPFGPPFLARGETRTLSLPQSTVCQIPASAKAYALNVTLVPRGTVGVDFATIYPAGDSRPTFWTVRSPDAQIVANSAIVRAGVNGGVSVFASDATDVLIDIIGYFTDDPNLPGLTYYPLAPCRVVDTRVLYRPATGPFGPPTMPAGQRRSFAFPEAAQYCQIPAGAKAYSITLTVVPWGPLQFLTTWPTGGAQPNVSSINSPAGRVLANNILLAASAAGSIDAYAFDRTDVIMDITGYFAPDDGQNGLLYFPVPQCRAHDSQFGDEQSRTIGVATLPGCSGIPSTAKAYAINVTSLPAGSPMPYLTAYPTGQPRPVASMLNAFEGQTVTNSAIVPSGVGASIDLFAYRKTQVVVEVSGYFSR